MPTATTCIYEDNSISIERALEIRNAMSGTPEKGVFKCVECGKAVKPMKDGGHTSAASNRIFSFMWKIPINLNHTHL